MTTNFKNTNKENQDNKFLNKIQQAKMKELWNNKEDEFYNKMCLKCNSKLRKVEVKIVGAKSKVISYQCPKDNYFEFEKESSSMVLSEIKPH